MLRYTALLHTSAHPADLAVIKQAVESILLRAYSPITYRLGSMGEVRHGLVLVEIATDARKEYLCQLLKGLENKYPLQVEEVGWGWTLTKPGRETRPDVIRSGLEDDPFAGAAPEPEPARAYRLNGRQAGWLILRIMLWLYLLFCIIAVVVNGYAPNPSGDWLAAHFGLMCIPILMVLLMSDDASRPLRFCRVASSIEYDSNGIQINYWLVPNAKRLQWSDIQALEITSSECILRTVVQTVKFRLNSLYGRHDYPGLYSMIVQRASLHFVGIMGSSYVYKRFTAP